MAERWYYRHSTAELGPVTLAQLIQLAQNGQLTVSDWVRDGETNPWRPVSKVPQLASLLGAPRAAAPPVARPAPAAHLSSPAPIPQPLPLGAASAAPRPAPHHSGTQPPLPLPMAPAPLPAPRVRAMPAPAPARAPLGAAPAPLPLAAPVPVVPMPGPATPGERPSALERRGKKSSASTMITLAVCGVGGVLVLVIVAVMASMSGEPATDDKEIAASTASAESDDAPPASNDRLSTVQASMTRSIHSWRDATKKGVLKGLISFEVKRVSWIHAPGISVADAKKFEAAAKEMANTLAEELKRNPGLGVEPADVEKRKEMAKQLPQVEVSGVTSAGPRLQIEMAITNVAPTPIAYHSWNSNGKSGAWVVDKQLKFVGAASGTPRSQQLAPQQTITDTLEFAVESADFDELRLVLPYGAIDRSGQWGYTLSGPMLHGKAAPTQETVAAAQPKPPMETDAAKPADPLVIQAPEQPMPGVAAVIKEPVVDDGEPKEDIRDLIKKSVEKK